MCMNGELRWADGTGNILPNMSTVETGHITLVFVVCFVVGFLFLFLLFHVLLLQSCPCVSTRSTPRMDLTFPFLSQYIESKGKKKNHQVWYIPEKAPLLNNRKQKCARNLTKQTKQQVRFLTGKDDSRWNINRSPQSTHISREWTHRFEWELINILRGLNKHVNWRSHSF